MTFLSQTDREDFDTFRHTFGITIGSAEEIWKAMREHSPCIEDGTDLEDFCIDIGLGIDYLDSVL